MRDAKLAIEFLQKNTHQDDGKRADGRWRAGFNCPFVGIEGEAPRAQEGEDGSRVEASRSTWTAVWFWRSDQGARVPPTAPPRI